MQLIGIHGHNGMDGCDVLRPAIAKAFGTGFNSADTEGLVGVGLKGVAGDMGVIQLHARQLRQMAKARAVSLIEELFGYALHGEPPRGSDFIIRDDPRGCHNN